MIRGQGDRVIAWTDLTIQRGEQIPERPIEPHENILNLMAVGTVIVADPVEGRETDGEQLPVALPRGRSGTP